MTPDPQGYIIHPANKEQVEVDALRRLADQLSADDLEMRQMKSATRDAAEAPPAPRNRHERRRRAALSRRA